MKQRVVCEKTLKGLKQRSNMTPPAPFRWTAAGVEIQGLPWALLQLPTLQMGCGHIKRNGQILGIS